LAKVGLRHQVPTFGSASLILTLASKWGCDTLVEEVAILDGPSQDTSTNIFEFSPPSSTSKEPSECSDQHLAGLIKVVTFRQALTNKIVELQEKWDVSQVPINLQDYMLH